MAALFFLLEGEFFPEGSGKCAEHANAECAECHARFFIRLGSMLRSPEDELRREE